MSKLQKKTLEAVGWLGSSGYQTILHSQAAKKNGSFDKKPAATRKVASKAQADSATRPKN